MYVDNMPITVSGQSNVNLLMSVAPTSNADTGNITLTWPSSLPTTTALLQANSNGSMAWVSSSGLPPGEARSYAGSFIGTTQGSGTATQLSRATGGGTSLSIPVPSQSPSGFYLEAVVRVLNPDLSQPASFSRVFSAALYQSGSYIPNGNVSYQGDVGEYVYDISFTMQPSTDGTGGALLGLTVTADAGCKVDADLVCLAEPQS
jgi:hypothetical protein